MFFAMFCCNISVNRHDRQKYYVAQSLYDYGHFSSIFHLNLTLDRQSGHYTDGMEEPVNEKSAG